MSTMYSISWHTAIQGSPCPKLLQGRVIITYTDYDMIIQNFLDDVQHTSSIHMLVRYSNIPDSSFSRNHFGTTQICCYQNAQEAPVKQLPRADYVTTKIIGESKVTRTSSIHHQVLTIMQAMLFYSKLKKFFFCMTVWQVIQIWTPLWLCDFRYATDKH